MLSSLTKFVVFVLALFCGLQSIESHAAELTGTVTHVRDGDTILVRPVPIRLSGLHAPELSKPNRTRATEFMRNLVLGKSVTCHLNGEKTYDRFAAICWLGPTDIAAELVAAGLGRDCPRFSEGRYAGIELESTKTMPLPKYCTQR